MPTYDYKCKNDHHVEEFRMMMKRNEERPCPECGETLTMQVPSGERIGIKWAKGMKNTVHTKDKLWDPTVIYPTS